MTKFPRVSLNKLQGNPSYPPPPKLPPSNKGLIRPYWRKLGGYQKLKPAWPDHKLLQLDKLYHEVNVLLRRNANQPVQSASPMLTAWLMPLTRLTCQLLAEGINDSTLLAFMPSVWTSEVYKSMFLPEDVISGWDETWTELDIQACDASAWIRKADTPGWWIGCPLLNPFWKLNFHHLVFFTTLLLVCTLLRNMNGFLHQAWLPWNLDKETCLL